MRPKCYPHEGIHHHFHLSHVSSFLHKAASYIRIDQSQTHIGDSVLTVMFFDENVLVDGIAGCTLINSRYSFIQYCTYVVLSYRLGLYHSSKFAKKIHLSISVCS